MNKKVEVSAGCMREVMVRRENKNPGPPADLRKQSHLRKPAAKALSIIYHLKVLLEDTNNLIIQCKLSCFTHKEPVCW